MTSAGIDYGRGMTNIDHATGIRYGVIGQGAIMPEALSDLEAEYGPASCPECGVEMPEDWEEGEVNGRVVCPRGHEFYRDSAWGDNPIAWSYDSDGYQITQSGDDTDLFVLKSPYYTFAQFCSPCAPGAGHLENPTPNGVPTYALGHDWFESGVAPYPLYSVETRTIVAPEAESENAYLARAEEDARDWVAPEDES